MSSSYYTMRSLSPARRRVLEQHRRFGLKTCRSNVNQLLEAVSPYEECIEVKAVSAKAAGAKMCPGSKEEPVDLSSGSADVVPKEDDDPAGDVDPPAPLELERTVDDDDEIEEREPSEEHIYRELEGELTATESIVLTGIPTEVVILPTSSTVVSSSESSSTTSSVNVRTLTPPMSFDDDDVSTSHHNQEYAWDDDQEDEWPSDEERSVNKNKTKNYN